jgi:TIR domain
MSVPSGPYFFVSYSRADISVLRRIVTELRKRGLNAWVDTENLIPGSPAWEHEIERSIRGAAGVIVLLSPDSNNSQWVRRELSFAEEIDKYLFPVHVRGDENDSIPLRLAAHQRVDLRSNFNPGMDGLAAALNGHLGATKVIDRSRLKQRPALHLPSGKELKKFVLPAALVLVGLFCIGGIALAARAISNVRVPTPTAPLNTTVPREVTSTHQPRQAWCRSSITLNQPGRSFTPATSAATNCASSMRMEQGRDNSRIRTGRPTPHARRTVRRSST